jgi:primosomal protein N' (replication factor Y)
VLGPEFPVIAQVQMYYIKTILIKIEKERSPGKVKEMISTSISKLRGMRGSGGLRISVDVDPY